MEIWNLYNERRELTGRTHTRGEAIPQGCYHLVVHVWIRNSQGEYLISQRSADRPTPPLKWECVGGSVLRGETSLDGALRETLEEVGVTLSPENGTPVFSKVRDTVGGIRFADILDVWLFQYDGQITLEKALTKEVARSAWMSKAQIKNLFDSGELVHTLGYFFDTEKLY